MKRKITRFALGNTGAGFGASADAARTSSVIKA
jgi:hypothetical protein